jgi:hypothetical protein
MTVYHQNSPLGQFQSYLDSTTCRCRDDKNLGRHLCWKCYRALPEVLSREYDFARSDEDRMEAFDDAKDWLESNGL